MRCKREFYAQESHAKQIECAVCVALKFRKYRQTKNAQRLPIPTAAPADESTAQAMPPLAATYARYVATAMSSLVQAHPGRKLSIHVLDSGMSEASRLHQRAHCRRYVPRICLICGEYDVHLAGHE